MRRAARAGRRRTPPSVSSASLGLPTLPTRLSLLQEGAHALSEVLAQVAGDDQVAALAGIDVPSAEDPADSFLYRPDGERGVGRDLLGESLDAGDQRLLRIDQLIDQADRKRLGRVERSE